MEIASSFLFVADAAVYNATGMVLVALGLLISIRFLNFPDLTADGSFTIGAGVYAALASTGGSTVVSLAIP